jgi:hypothetical protein
MTHMDPPSYCKWVVIKSNHYENQRETDYVMVCVYE